MKVTITFVTNESDNHFYESDNHFYESENHFSELVMFT